MSETYVVYSDYYTASICLKTGRLNGFTPTQTGNIKEFALLPAETAQKMLLDNNIEAFFLANIGRLHMAAVSSLPRGYLAEKRTRYSTDNMG